MSDDEQVETTEKRSPGRSRTKRRGIQRQPIHNGPRADTALVNFVYNPELPGSPFDIDPEILAGILRDYGFKLEWHIQEVAGKVMDQFITQRARNRWAPVRKGNFGGVLDHLADRDGYMRRDGLLLEGRPHQIQDMAVAHRLRAAKDQVQQNQRSHAMEGVPVAGGSEEVARKKNFHKQSYEPVKIPE
jgi:hypothetical protein